MRRQHAVQCDAMGFMREIAQVQQERTRRDEVCADSVEILAAEYGVPP